MSKRWIIAWVLCLVATILLGVWMYTDRFAALAVAFVVLVPAYFLFKRELTQSPNQAQ